MSGKLLTIEAIKSVVSAIAVKYGVEKVFVFGSYARGDATPLSDVDLHIEKGQIKDLIELSEFQIALETAMAVHVDVVTTGSLEEVFLKRIQKEEILIYEH